MPEPCPQCHEHKPLTRISHSTLGEIIYPTCQACTYQQLHHTATIGGFVMSQYATVRHLERDRYAYHYLDCLKGMTYRMEYVTAEVPTPILTRHGHQGHHHDNAHYEWWMKLESLIEQLYLDRRQT